MMKDTDANQTRFDPDAEAQGRKCDHEAAKELAQSRPSYDNLAACYLDSQAYLADLTQRHKKLLELAEASVNAAHAYQANPDYVTAFACTSADTALRALVEEERKRTP